MIITSLTGPACRSPVCRDRVFSRKAFEPTDEELALVAKKEEEDVKPFKFAKPEKVAGLDQDEEMPDIFQLIRNGSGSQPSASGSGEGKASKCKSKVKGKAVKKRTKRLVVDSEEEDEDDAMNSDNSLDDFIVNSDEDEEMKDERKQLKRLHKRKPAKDDSGYGDSDVDEMFDEVIIGPGRGKGREEIDVNVIKTLPKTLPSTKMMVT